MSTTSSMSQKSTTSRNSLSDAISIVGVGESPYHRRSSEPVTGLITGAVKAAVEDAGLSLDEVDGIVTDSTIGPVILPADELAANLGLPDRVFHAQMSTGGSGVVGAPMLAAQAIASGMATTVVCYFGVDWGSSAGGPYQFHGTDPYKANLEMPFGFYGQPIYFAPVVRRYAHQYGLTEEELANVAISTRAWAALHPGAMKRTALTLEDYRCSPVLADPLRVLDCCLLTDGGAAYVMTSTERARDLPHKPVKVSGVSFSSSRVSSHSYLSQHEDYLSTQAQVTGPRAMGMAGVTPEDVDFLEIYDCFTISCLLQAEDLGFAPKGTGASLFAEGNAAPGGRLPINTHGGLLSHAYVLGINHVVEAVRQLRGDCGERQVPGAEVGLVSGYSGWEHSSLVLTA
ncbi:MAG: thiolase family protein [Pseudonocardia sp.]